MGLRPLRPGLRAQEQDVRAARAAEGGGRGDGEGDTEFGVGGAESVWGGGGDVGCVLGVWVLVSYFPN